MGATTRIVYKQLVDVPAVMRRAVAETLGMVADAHLESANRRIPLEEGIMQDSGFTEVDTGSLTAQVAYADVAGKLLKQHEDPTLRHDDDREDHWLERDMERRNGDYQSFIAAEVRRRMGG